MKSLTLLTQSSALLALSLLAACSSDGGASGPADGDGSGGGASADGAGGDASAPGGGGPSSGGSATGGSGTGGSGGASSAGGGTDGAGGSAPAEPTLAERYPCDGSTDGYDRVVSASGGGWSMNGDSYATLQAAMTAALAGGGASESDLLTVLVQDDGELPANVQQRVFSNTLLNVCGTITVVAPEGGSDRSPVYARGASNLIIPNLTIRGDAQYGVFLREVEDVHFGKVDIRLSGGMGMRIDNNPAGNSWANSASNAARVAGFRIDDAYIEGVSMGIEFYGAEDIELGSFVVRDTSEAGLMLNNSRDVEVGSVDGQGVSPNAGYAVFRMANDNGKDWDSGTFPMSVHVGKVTARASGGPSGQGIFCLTDSGGVSIDEVDIEDTAGNSIWLEWCTNVKLGSASKPSRIHSAGTLLISYGTETRQSNDLVLENIAITDTNISFNHDCPPNIEWTNVTRDGAAVTECE
jgi:hypothetical protein